MILTRKQEEQVKAISSRVSHDLFGKGAESSRAKDAELINEIILNIATQFGIEKIDQVQFIKIIREQCAKTTAGMFSGGIYFPDDKNNLGVTQLRLVQAITDNPFIKEVEDLGNTISKKLFSDGIKGSRKNDAFLIKYALSTLTAEQLAKAKEEQELLVDAIRNHCNYTAVGYLSGGITFLAEQITPLQTEISKILDNDNYAQKLKLKGEINQAFKYADNPVDKSVLIICKNLDIMISQAKKHNVVEIILLLPDLASLLAENFKNITDIIRGKKSVNPLENNEIKELINRLLDSEQFPKMLKLCAPELSELLKQYGIDLPEASLTELLEISPTLLSSVLSKKGELQAILHLIGQREYSLKFLWPLVNNIIATEDKKQINSELIKLINTDAGRALVIEILKNQNVAPNLKWLGVNDDSRQPFIKFAAQLLNEGGERSHNGLFLLMNTFSDNIEQGKTFKGFLSTGLQQLLLNNDGKLLNSVQDFIKNGGLAKVYDALLEEESQLLPLSLHTPPLRGFVQAFVHNLKDNPQLCEVSLKNLAVLLGEQSETSKTQALIEIIKAVVHTPNLASMLTKVVLDSLKDFVASVFRYFTTIENYLSPILNTAPGPDAQPRMLHQVQQKESLGLQYAIEKRDLSGADLRQCSFDKWIVDGFKFDNCTLGNELKGDFRNCDFINCKFSDHEIDLSKATFDKKSAESISKAAAANHIDIIPNTLLSTLIKAQRNLSPSR